MTGRERIINVLEGKKVKEVTDIARPYGNFILAASDYFCEGTPYENIRAYADAALEYGSY